MEGEWKEEIKQINYYRGVYYGRRIVCLVGNFVVTDSRLTGHAIKGLTILGKESSGSSCLRRARFFDLQVQCHLH